MEEALKVRDGGSQETRRESPGDRSKRENMGRREESGAEGRGKGRQGPRLGGPGLRAQTEVGAWREPPALPVLPPKAL